MGKTYLVAEDDLKAIPQFVDMGPDVLDPAFDDEAFLKRLRK